MSSAESLEKREAVQQPSTPEANSTTGMNRARPRHYHLLWDDELKSLEPIAKMMLVRLDEMIGYWQKLYVLHFGEERTLAESEFHEIFFSALFGTLRALF